MLFSSRAPSSPLSDSRRSAPRRRDVASTGYAGTVVSTGLYTDAQGVTWKLRDRCEDFLVGAGCSADDLRNRWLATQGDGALKYPDVTVLGTTFAPPLAAGTREEVLHDVDVFASTHAPVVATPKTKVDDTPVTKPKSADDYVLGVEPAPVKPRTTSSSDGLTTVLVAAATAAAAYFLWL